MLTRGAFFYPDNALGHISMVAMTTIRDCLYELVPHPPYLPDLAPFDFHLFSKMEKFWLVAILPDAVQRFVESQLNEIFFTMKKALQSLWRKCSTFEEDYVEGIIRNKVP